MEGKMKRFRLLSLLLVFIMLFSACAKPAQEKQGTEEKPST